MYLKIMSTENAPDGDSRKTYRFLANVDAVNFVRVNSEEDGPKVGAFAFVTFTDGTRESFDVEGNAYLLNDTGKTLSSWGSASIPEDAYPAAA